MKWILAAVMSFTVMFAQGEYNWENQECHQVEECE